MIRQLVVSGMRFHCWQSGQGADLVLVHGVAADLSLWHFTILSRLQDGRRVTAYDLRGHGRSDQPPTGYTSRDMVGDLVGILDAADIGDADFAGHSYGADVALHLATLYPDRVRRVVAIEAGLPMFAPDRYGPHWAGWEEWARALERETGCRRAPAFWHRAYSRLRRGEPADELAAAVAPATPAARRLLRLLTRTSLVTDYGQPAGLTLDALASLSCPLLLLYGEDSTYLSTCRLLQRLLPRAEAEHIAGADHFSILNHPDRLASRIRSFLRGGPEPRPAG